MMTQANTQGTEQAAPLTEQEKKELLDKWGPEQMVKVQKCCFNNGITFTGFNEEHCLSIPPFIGIWHFNTATKGESYWAISGEFPADIASVKVAKDARDAVRYFAMSWQLKAVRMEDALAEGKVQQDDKEMHQRVIADLIKKAESLAIIHSDDRFWEGSNLKIA